MIFTQNIEVKPDNANCKICLPEWKCGQHMLCFKFRREPNGQKQIYKLLPDAMNVLSIQVKYSLDEDYTWFNMQGAFVVIA